MLSTLLAGCQAAGLTVMNALAPRVDRTTDIVFSEGPRGRMDIYSPKHPEEGVSPLVVFWYGGGWTQGNRGSYRFVGAALAARGAVTALPDYRLYPEVRFPAFLEDAAAAVARAQQEAPRHGANPRHTVLGGHSAGAYIAAMLALQPEYLRDAGVDPNSIVGFFGLSGPYALDPDSAELHEIFTSQAGPEAFQPLRQVEPDAPPALLVHGTADRTVYISHSQALASALKQAGARVELQLIPARRHVDTVIALSRPAGFRIPGLLDAVSEFIHDPLGAQLDYSVPTTMSLAQRPADWWLLRAR